MPLIAVMCVAPSSGKHMGIAHEIMRSTFALWSSQYHCCSLYCWSCCTQGENRLSCLLKRALKCSDIIKLHKNLKPADTEVPLLLQDEKIRLRILGRLDLSVHDRLSVGQLPALAHWKPQTPEKVKKSERWSWVSRPNLMQTEQEQIKWHNRWFSL